MNGPASCKTQTNQQHTMKTKPIIQILAACAVIANATAQAPVKPSSPDEAFAELRVGNQRFAGGLTKQRDLLAEAKDTSGGQKPFAAVLSCIDSRTSSEIIFDQGIGDIFNARLAGNVADEDVLGSLEFATKVAGAKLIAVIGHSGCGAVIGAIDGVKLGHLTNLLSRIEPAVAEAKSGGDASANSSKSPAFVNQCIADNVRLQAKQLTKQSAILKELADSGKIKIVGGVHDLETGRVEFIDVAD